MFGKLVNTSNDATLTLLRAVLGAIMFAHGCQKMFGWFGGYGFSGTMGYFTQQMHIPTVFALLSIFAEFFGGLGLFFGALTRIAAFGVACNMVVAALMAHMSNGLFMNWSGSQKGEGFEYHLLAVAMALTVMVKGAGAFSIDRLLTPKPKPAGFRS